MIYGGITEEGFSVVVLRKAADAEPPGPRKEALRRAAEVAFEVMDHSATTLPISRSDAVASLPISYGKGGEMVPPSGYHYQNSGSAQVGTFEVSPGHAIVQLPGGDPWDAPVIPHVKTYDEAVAEGLITRPE